MCDTCRGSASLSTGQQVQVKATAGNIAAAGAIPSLVAIVGSSQNRALLLRACYLLGALAWLSQQRAEAITEAGGTAPLVQLWRTSVDDDLQASAAQALFNISGDTVSNGEAPSAAIAAAGAVPAAIDLLSSSHALAPERAAALLCSLAAGSRSLRQAIISAGGAAALVRGLRGSTHLQVSCGPLQAHMLAGLHVLADGGTEGCRAIAAAGGARECVAVLGDPPSHNRQVGAENILCLLARHGQSQAFVAADPSGAVEAALEGCLPVSTPEHRR